MNDKKFQLSFNWKDIISFSFFSLLSFGLLFYLGFLLGKDSLKETQTTLQIENSQSKDISDGLKDEYFQEKKTEIPATIKTKKKPTEEKISKKNTVETEELFGENSYVIQIASYKELAKAERLVSRLQKSFYPAYLKNYKKNSEIYYRVRLGSYSKKEVERVQKELEKELKKEFPNLVTSIFKIK